MDIPSFRWDMAPDQIHPPPPGPQQKRYSNIKFEINITS